LGPPPKPRCIAPSPTASSSWKPLSRADWTRIAELTQQYSDQPLGGVDAGLIAVAERLGLTTIATLDRRHFGVVRPNHAKVLTLIP
jgi:predicted nucleic acid-binding protein